MLTDDSGMAAAVQEYLDEIEFVRSTHEVLCEHTERTLHCSIDGLGGTVDHLMIYREDGKVVLHSWDYKHGVGVPVDAVENMQLLSYFVILDDNYPGMIDEFRGTIIQPRAFSGEVNQTWCCTPERVKQHADRIEQVKHQDHLAAGDWCRWCPALLICPEVRQHTLNMARTEFSDLDLDTLLSLEAVMPAVQALMKMIPVELLNRFRRGDAIPGKKVIATLSNRRWARNTEETWAELESLGLSKSDFIEERLKTPPQVEKLLDKDGKKSLASLVTRTPSGYKVVPESARGEPVNFSDVSDFDDLEFENGES